MRFHVALSFARAENPGVRFALGPAAANLVRTVTSPAALHTYSERGTSDFCARVCARWKSARLVSNALPGRIRRSYLKRNAMFPHQLFPSYFTG